MLKKLIAAITAVLISAGCAGAVETLSGADYPECAPYPEDNFNEDYSVSQEKYQKWAEDRSNRRKAAQKISDSPDEFFKNSADVFLSSEENTVYSPVSAYAALAMLAECTDGNSRAELLEALNCEDMETLRNDAENMWLANYQNDGATTSIIANSLWLDDSIKFVKDTTNIISDRYYASVFRGRMGSKEMNFAYRNWLNKQTGGFLKEQVESSEFDDDTVMGLCSALYFRAKWDTTFLKKNNDIKTFHTANGDIETEFMNGSNDYKIYYSGENYGAISLKFVEEGSMWFILPDEGVSVDDVLSEGKYLDMISNADSYSSKKELVVNYSVPKFDISSNIMLDEGLNKLGVSDIFNRDKADFSPLTEDAHGAFINSAKQSARVAIDEEGCTAAAFTEMIYAGAGLSPKEEMDFIIDRPFIYVIEYSSPLFIGRVDDPQ